MAHPDAQKRWDTDRDETEAQRLDRNWSGLLQELRVAQTGVQLLTGFLLTLPFQQRFTQLDGVMRTVYLVTVACSIGATVLLVAPVSMHRLLFRPARLQHRGVGRAHVRDGGNSAARCRPRRGGRRHLRHRGWQDGRLGRGRVHIAGTGCVLVRDATGWTHRQRQPLLGFAPGRPGEQRAHVDPTYCAPDVVSGFHQPRRRCSA